MCGYLVDDKNIYKLKNLEVKDSKLLTAGRRGYLAKKLKNIAQDFVLLNISARGIDKLRTISNLNRLEIQRMQDMINFLQPDKVIIDALEANTKKFHSKVSSRVKNKNIKIITENFADKNFIEVSAASILAKVQRDEGIKKLQKKFGDFGSGYSSDPKTIRFLKDWIKSNKEFPYFVRKSWLTIQYIKEEKEQTKLIKFLVNGWE